MAAATRAHLRWQAEWTDRILEWEYAAMANIHRSTTPRFDSSIVDYPSAGVLSKIQIQPNL